MRMLIRRKILILVFSLFFLLSSVNIPVSYGKVANYKFGMFTRINDIYVVGNKIWLGTDNGIYVVTPQGYVLSVIDNTYGLPDLYIKKIVVDDRGRVFVLTSLGLSVIYMDKHVSQNFSTYEGLPLGAFQAIDVSRNYIVIASSEQIWILNLNSGRRYIANVGSYVTDLKLVGEKIFVASYGGFYQYEVNGKLSRVFFAFRTNDLERYRSYLYLATENGIYRLFLSDLSLVKEEGEMFNGEFEKIKVSNKRDIIASRGNELFIIPYGGRPYKLSIGMSDNSITAIALYDDHDVLVALTGKKNAGLYVVENMFYVRQIMKLDSYLRNNVVSYVKPENMSIVWFKYGEQLYWFNKPGKFYRFQFMSSDRKAIDSSIIISIAPWITGDKLALGTVLGFYVANKISRIISQLDVSSLISESIVDIDTDGKGKYFILTRKYLYLYNAYTGYFKRVVLPQGEYAYDEFYYDGAIYIATTKSILKYYDNVIVSRYDLTSGATRIVGTLGGIWAITNGNLLFLDRHLQKAIPVKVFNELEVVDVDRWGRYLVVATEEGVFLYRKGKIWGVYAADEGLFQSNLITDIAVWNSYLVVGTRSGISIVYLSDTYIPFRDVDGWENLRWLHRLTALGILKGSPNGKMMLDSPVTNEQLVVFLARVFDIAPSDTCEIKNAHKWAIPYICGYFKGKVPYDVDWTEKLTKTVIDKYFSFLVLPSTKEIYKRGDVLYFLYRLIYSTGLWR